MIPSARRRLPAKALMLAASVALTAATLAPERAHAQSSVESLNAKVERLQRELTDLQRAFYRQGGTAPAATSGEVSSETTGGPATARLAVRMTELEEQVRSLTGEVEQLGFRLRQLSQRLETFSGDTDYRLQLLEKGSASARPAGEVEAGGVASSSAGAGRSQAAQSGDSASQPRTLGQVRQSDVDALRQQDGAQDGAQSTVSSSQQTAAASTGPAGAYQLPEGTPEAKYDHAFGLLRQMKYDDAERALSAFLQQHPDHQLAGNAKYWLGETYYVRGDFQNAAVAFAEGFKDYPESNKAEDNLLKLGISLGELGRTSDACGALGELLNRYPDLSQALRQRAVREQQRLGCN